ncbi:hypothetical protein C0J52_12015 [Blattella germanica]|nr:hypothetical protein C0J52_12015 [Blattella germanica]
MDRSCSLDHYVSRKCDDIALPPPVPKLLPPSCASYFQEIKNRLYSLSEQPVNFLS